MSDRNYTITHSTTLVTEECCRCGVLFAMPKDLQQELLNDRTRYFYCPNGHSQHYLGKTEEQKLREKLEETEARLERTRTQARATRDQLEASERSRSALRGQITKTKRRVSKGVCPCCNRSFPDLANHMQSKHPDYGDDHPHEH